MDPVFICMKTHLSLQKRRLMPICSQMGTVLFYRSTEAFILTIHWKAWAKTMELGCSNPGTKLLLVLPFLSMVSCALVKT